MSRHFHSLTFLSGCIFGIAYQVVIGTVAWAWIGILLAVLCIVFIEKAFSYTAVLVIGIVIGFGYSYVARAITTPHIAYGEERSFAIEVTGNPVAKGSGATFTAKTAQASATAWPGRHVAYSILVQTDAYPVRHIGDLLTVTGTVTAPPTIQGFDYPQVLAHDGVFAVIKNPTISSSGHDASLLIRFHDWVSTKERAIEQRFSEPEASLVSAIVLGDKSSVSPELKVFLSNAGMSHLISVGGITIALSLEAADTLWPLRHTHLRILLLLAIVTFLFILTSGAASVIRGGVFAFLQRVIRSAGRRVWPLPLLLLTALILLVWNPLEITNAGFQLSLSAYVGILFGAPLLTKLFMRLRVPKPVAELFVVSIAITVATLPVAYIVFGQIPFWSIVVSPLIYTLLPYILLLGSMYIAVSSVPVLSTLVSIPLWFPVHFLVQTGRFIGKLGNRA